MVTPEDNTPHNCDSILFIDGLCYKGEKVNLAGYAVVRYNVKTDGFENMILQHLSQPSPLFSSVGKIKSTHSSMGTGQVCNIYTESAYAYGVCHMYGSIWAQRGFVHADGTKIPHGEAIMELLEAMQLPEKVAIIKCAGHKTD